MATAKQSRNKRTVVGVSMSSADLTKLDAQASQLGVSRATALKTMWLNLGDEAQQRYRAIAAADEAEAESVEPLIDALQVALPRGGAIALTSAGPSACRTTRSRSSATSLQQRSATVVWRRSQPSDSMTSSLHCRASNVSSSRRARRSPGGTTPFSPRSAFLSRRRGLHERADERRRHRQGAYGP